MSVSGGGWALLFDDTGKNEIRQEMSSQLKNVPFKELLAYTPDDIENGRVGRSTFLYVSFDRLWSSALHDCHCSLSTICM